MKDYKAIAQATNEGVKTLREAHPEIVKAFGGLQKAAHSGDALEVGTKELMALAIAIALRCDGCIAHHAGQAVKLGASRSEVVETIAVAIEMGGGPSLVYGQDALRAFDQMSG